MRLLVIFLMVFPLGSCALLNTFGSKAVKALDAGEKLDLLIQMADDNRFALRSMKKEQDIRYGVLTTQIDNIRASVAVLKLRLASLHASYDAFVSSYETRYASLEDRVILIEKRLTISI